MPIPDKIAEVLSPHLGAHSADAVARHLCAKYDITEDSDVAKFDELQEFLRRGLVAYVSRDTADELANQVREALKRPS